MSRQLLTITLALATLLVFTTVLLLSEDVKKTDSHSWLGRLFLQAISLPIVANAAAYHNTSPQSNQFKTAS